MTTIIRTRPPLSVSDLAPRLFARIRKLYRIQPEDFIQSLRHVRACKTLSCMKPACSLADRQSVVLLQTVKERFSEGASGAFFCESHDGKYVIKSMHRVRTCHLPAVLRTAPPRHTQHW